MSVLEYLVQWLGATLWIMKNFDLFLIGMALMMFVLEGVTPMWIISIIIGVVIRIIRIVLKKMWEV